jgi:hypothetical protein
MTAVRDRIETKDGFVEVIPAENVVTDRTCVKIIDIPSVTLEALDFQAPFELIATKESLCHGFCASFDIGFETNLPHPLRFSTGVEATPTHWQQVFFHVSKPFTVKAGDRLRGTWAVCRNMKNPRFLDIEIMWSHGPHQFQEKFFLHN